VDPERERPTGFVGLTPDGHLALARNPRGTWWLTAYIQLGITGRICRGHRIAKDVQVRSDTFIHMERRKGSQDVGVSNIENERVPT
jgi:hypothetical protein